VSRLGGDEFVVVMQGVAGRADVQQLVEQRLIPLIRQAHVVEGHELHVSCSVGMALYPEDGQDLEGLMRRADAAMYEAKATGRDMACFYSVQTDQRALARQSLEQHLRRALERNELSLHYQPRVRAQNGQLVGVEALLRWTHPALGLVPPSEFIHIAEETGLIRTIGAWVLQEACAQWMRWRRATGPGAQALGRTVMSVNLSAAQLADPQLVPDVQAVLARLGMPASALELEITESQLMDNAHAAQQQLAALKALGVHLSIDDFGTGYSSLAYLKRFDIDKLKIDRSFVRELLTNPADMAITRAIIALGGSLGLKLVAEGVEDMATGRVLTALGCDELQGFHFSRPLPVPALEC
ncbi:MAG: bifunctional diguanylate cyclase/phosphodiesterase, partial [Acidovorax sp.]|nr:bifunctional diguanylate cyclase/phosphodiesterase [Acidovorax sp.]